MRPEPLIAGIEPFDLEGYLFIHFPLDAWLNGQARKVLEMEIRRNGDGRIDHATILTAIHSMRWRIMEDLKPCEIEAMRIHGRPELSVRFPPYWVQNGGKHTPAELTRQPDWEFGEGSWEFGEDEPKTSASKADGWDFGAGEDGWGF